MTKLKLGKKAPKFSCRTLLFGKYLTAALPEAPASVMAYARPVAVWPMMGNDRYGDCTCAAAGHMIQEWTANAGKEVTLTDAQILAAYGVVSGGQDGGAAMLDVLNYWRQTGIGSDKITAYAQLESQNDSQARDAIYLFGSCYLGLALPDFVLAPGVDPREVPWVVPPAGLVSAPPNQNNGHCVPAIGYDSRNVYIVTWGIVKAMSWQFFDAYVEEAFAVLSGDWISKKVGTSPAGFNMAQLTKDLAEVTK